MATIITVHGTNDTGPPEGHQWWQRGSFFEQSIRELVESEDGTLAVEPLIWDGRNSETSRREASAMLEARLCELEAKGEPYSVVGHSHGGTVIASALIDCAVNKRKTDLLRNWITVGTPFVRLRRELLLFSRIPTYQKSIFVGFFSLIMMLMTMVLLKVLYGPSEAVAELASVSNTEDLVKTASTWLGVFFSLSGVFLLFYAILWILDARKFRAYRRSRMQAANQRYASRWVSLCHEDDEAVQGLATLGRTKVPIFHKDFAIPLFASASVFVLPLIYFIIIFSPVLSSGLTRLIAQTLYFNESYSTLAEQEVKKRVEIGELRNELTGIIASLAPGQPGGFSRWRNREAVSDAQARAGEERGDGQDSRAGGWTRWSPEEREARRKQWQQRREELLVKATPEQRDRIAEISEKQRTLFLDLKNLRRVATFKQNFLNDQGELLFGGRNPAKNSELVFRVFTTEVENLFKDLFDERMVQRSWLVEALAFAIIFVAMPLVFALISLAILYGFRFIAFQLSGRISAFLDSITWGELKRAAFGNDTISEIAEAAAPHPVWVNETRPFLPTGLANEIAQRSNDVAATSLVKLRNAISELAFSERAADQASVIEEYITWNELIHTTYFQVDGFRKLVAYALTQGAGFRPTAAFREDPDYALVAGWYADINKALPFDAGEPSKTA